MSGAVPAGEVAVQEVAVQETPVAGCPPKLIAAPARLLPLTVTTVPPAGGPEAGLTAVTTGTGGGRTPSGARS